MTSSRGTINRQTEPLFEASSGNVFADLCFADHEEELAKAQLVLQIVELVRKNGLTQIKAAELLGLPRPKTSLLLRGQTRGFSTGCLIRFLNRLGQEVEIVVRPKATIPSSTGVRVVRRRALPAARMT